MQITVLTLALALVLALSAGGTESPVRPNCTPNGVVARLCRQATTPLGLSLPASFSQGGSCPATPGFEPESRWDSGLEFPEARNLARDPQHAGTLAQLRARWQMYASELR